MSDVQPTYNMDKPLLNPREVAFVPAIALSNALGLPLAWLKAEAKAGPTLCYPGSRWLGPPTMTVTRQTQTFSLLVKLDPKRLNLARNYALPLEFHGPSQVKTAKGVLILVINPKRISCILPAAGLRPAVEVTARLYKQGKPRWTNLDKRMAVWPMRLQLAFTTVPPLAWSEKIRWTIYGLDGVEVSTEGPIVSEGRPIQANVKLTRQVSLDELIKGKAFRVQVELRAVNKPKTLILSSLRMVLTTMIEPPAIQNTRIKQNVSFIGQGRRPKGGGTDYCWA